MLSLVIPVFNEEESLRPFYAELKRVLKEIDKAHEIIFVDDGSTDSSLQLLKDLENDDKTIRIFSFRRNHGKADALTQGFQKARGEFVITLDADLQDQPSDIPAFIAKQKEGIDVVCGWRKNRKDKSRMKVISKLFNALVHKAFDVPVHDYNCGYKLYTNEAAKSFRLYGGQHRFIPVLASNQGYVVDEVVVHHEVRKYGHSKYGFSKIFKDLPDMFSMLFLIKYQQRPLHFFGFVGGGLTMIGSVILLYMVVLRIMGERIGDRPLLIFGVLLFLAGLQIFFTGFMAELLTNISQKNDLHLPLKYSSDKE
jgi:glycosyltransferase involved in cell wall biosynthesis